MTTQTEPTPVEELTLSDIGFILESLSYTKMNFENYSHYPSYEFKRERIKEVDDLVRKLRNIRNARGKK